MIFESYEGIPSPPIYSPSEAIQNTFGVSLIPITDGRIHRFRLPQSHHENGWYCFYVQSFGTFGAFGDWATSSKFSYSSKGNTPLTEEEIAEIKKAQEAATIAEQEIRKNALDHLKSLYDKFTPIEAHPYTTAKQVGLYGDVRAWNSALVIPIRDRDGNLQTIQTIGPDGKKQWFTDCTPKGGRFIIPGNNRIFLCEGYATGASIHEATGATVVCAMQANNIKNVAPDYPGAMIIADNDESKTGERACEGFPFTLIPEVGLDANDFAVKYGKEALRKLLTPRAFSRSLADMVKNHKPIQYLIKGWLPKIGVGMIYGAPASGKSFTAIDIGLTISSGIGQWHGFKCKPGNTYYMCGEGQEGISKRGQAWMLKHTFNIGNFYVTEDAVYITDPTGLKTVEDDIDTLGWKPDIIIIDTLNRHCDKDENSATDMAIWNNACKELSMRYSCFVLVVHHTGIASEAQGRARGSSALRGANDCEFSCEKLGNRVTITQRKQKDIELGEPLQLETQAISLGPDFVDEDGEEQTSLVLTEADLTIADGAFAMLVYLHDKFLRDRDYPKDENGYYRVKTSVLIEFAKTWSREVENKSIDDKQARNKLRENGSIGCVLGENLKSLERGEWLVKCDGF